MAALHEKDMLAEPSNGFANGLQVEAGSVEGSLEEIDPVAEAKLVRKLDTYIIPVVMLLYLFSFLDR